jgi:hypothetical protein
MNNFFSIDFKNKEYRHSFYEHTETFISKNITSWDYPPETDSLALLYWSELKKLSNSELSFLTLVTGYIPEFYNPDSSQETLYSKLVEVLVAEAFLRIGFDLTTIQKQKSSKEDVTVRLPGKVIVCDAKTFRLGRSQAAPNVKDTLKKADYEKWLSYYPEHERVGGIITFPSLHRWKGSSDAYLYCTDYKSPIALMFYEHLSFILINSIPPSFLVEHLENYICAFPKPCRSQSEYFSAMDNQLFRDQIKEWSNFKIKTVSILDERVMFSKEKIVKHLKRKQESIETEVNSMEESIIRPKLVEAIFENQCSELRRQLQNIEKFRKPTLDT